jgi:molybdate transport system substrate-binding protein
MTKLILSHVATINRLAAFTITALLLFPGIAAETDIKVISSGGFAAAYRVLAPIFERTTGNHLVTSWGPSMGIHLTQCRNGYNVMSQSML